MIQVYTGEGKGKTTAGIGQAVRASASFPVLFLQFLKGGSSSEIAVLKKIPAVDVKIFGSGKRIYPDKGNKEEKKLVQEAFEWFKNNDNRYGVVILDEIVTAISLGLLEETQVLDALREKGRDREYVLTGHGASEELLELADLVTEMKPLKHYYNQGQQARKGIEY